MSTKTATLAPLSPAAIRPTRRDPRIDQLVVLSALLVLGLTRLGFPVDLFDVAAAFLGCLATQALVALLQQRPFDPRSAAISALSLSLLLRGGAPWVFLLAGMVAVGSKALLRWRGRHLFNPSALGIAVVVLGTDQAWVSPGQWGTAGVAVLVAGGLGSFVSTRAARLDTALAFLLGTATLVFGRALWLGDPLLLPSRTLLSGALWLFAFFMITDPRTTPGTRVGRILHGLAVAVGAAIVHFVWFRNNGYLWSLLALAPLVPVLDHWLAIFSERKTAMISRHRSRPPSSVAASPPALSARSARTLLLGLVLALALLVTGAERSSAFCGFYVARADATLYNSASQVVLVRDGDRTVLTMANDFRGDPKEFAMVIPVPTVLRREQIHVGDAAILDHLDAFTAPRLAEYFDPDPCAVARMERRMKSMDAVASVPEAEKMARQLGVSVEARYTVGEYDILLLAAEESRGLERWLRANDYRVPKGAHQVLDSYIRQGLHFFVARVNLKEQSKLGFVRLRPLQLAFETPRFGLPIRLGMLNADGEQELLLYALTRKGRVEPTNYRTVRMPSDENVPVYVRDRFADFYRDTFTTTLQRNGRRAVLLEYAWDMGWCDPCAADPLSSDELRGLGVFWVPEGTQGASDVFVTRLHLRYDAETFPDDLRLQVTSDRTNFQGRYVLRHAFSGGVDCPAARRYRDQLGERHEQEAQTLARLTGWDIAGIRREMGLDATATEQESWWQRLWPGR